MIIQAPQTIGESHVCKNGFNLNVELYRVGTLCANVIVAVGVLRLRWSILFPYFLYHNHDFSNTETSRQPWVG